jgi:putative peptide zinc metalloprotease protein
MTEPAASKEIKSKGLKVRKDLLMISADDGSMQIKDLANRQFYVLGVREARLFKLLAETDGPLDVKQLTDFTTSELKEFFVMLNQYGFLEDSAQKKPTPYQRNSLWFISQNVSLWNPDAFLTKLNKGSDLIWSLPFKILIFLVLAKGAMIGFEQYAQFASYGWPVIAESRFLSLIIFGIILALIFTGHEMMHGLALKHFGGNVLEMGFCLVYFSPSFYTDVTDIYKLSKKSQQVWVMLVGPLFQALTGCIGLILWSMAEPRSLIADLSYFAVVASFFSLGINLCPLIKSDAYYALERALNINDLRGNAWSYTYSLVTRQPYQRSFSARDKTIFLIYTPISIIYTWFVMIMLLSFYLNQIILSEPSIFAVAAVAIFILSGLRKKAPVAA